MGRTCGIGILPWNRHLAWKRCSAVLGRQCGLGGLPHEQLPWFPPLALCIKTLASCQFHAYLLAFCQFHAYFRAGRMPTLLLFII
ncbi:hypothetical protein [Moorena producens]|uniref:hypothetical protein n=1 Tax=Moorena producens TaxID=1155739 RepID=UPI003C715D79